MLSTLVRIGGRLALAPIFISGGINAAKNPAGRPDKAAATIDALREYLPAIPENDELVVRLNGVVQAAAGTALGLGVLPKASAAVLLASLVPTTIAGHDFWNETEPDKRAAQQLQFTKNAAIIGGLLSVIGSRR